MTDCSRWLNTSIITTNYNQITLQICKTVDVKTVFNSDYKITSQMTITPQIYSPTKTRLKIEYIKQNKRQAGLV